MKHPTPSITRYRERLPYLGGLSTTTVPSMIFSPISFSITSFLRVGVFRTLQGAYGDDLSFLPSFPLFPLLQLALFLALIESLQHRGYVHSISFQRRDVIGIGPDARRSVLRRKLTPPPPMSPCLLNLMIISFQLALCSHRGCWLKRVELEAVARGRPEI